MGETILRAAAAMAEPGLRENAAAIADWLSRQP
jgi:hypothetical protein